MPTNFDTNAATQGLATGMAVPNRNSGMADVIKTITNDLRAAATSRAEQQQKLVERQDKMRETNADMFKSLITAKYKLRPGANAEDFLSTGDVSMFEPPTDFAKMFLEGKGGQGGAGNFPPGTTYREGGFTLPLNPKYTNEENRLLDYAEGMSKDISNMKTLIKGDEGKKWYESSQFLGSGPFTVGPLVGIGEQGQEFANSQAQFSDRLLRMRSGAQINEQEYRRLRKLLPSFWRNDKLDLKVLEQFETSMRHIEARISKGYLWNKKTNKFEKNLNLSGGERPNFSSEGWIVMTRPDGQQVEVNAESYQEALASGYTEE